MRAYAKFGILTIFLSFCFFQIIVLSILRSGDNTFSSSYQSIIQDKYEILMETNEPKIIVVSGSSSAFGLDQKMLEDATGYKVANLGLHAGFGHLFYSELAKANINEGDIVLLGYEYGWQSGFESIDMNLVMTGIDEKLEMYTYIPKNQWKNCIGYLFKFAQIKNNYVEATGIYSREAFDEETCQMIYNRNWNMGYNSAEHGVVDLTGATISDSTVEYLLEFRRFVENSGAKVFFIAPPLVKDAVVCDYSEFTNLKEAEEALIGIPYISDPLAYLYPCELMSNALYHCNNRGEEVRTKMLIADMKLAGIVK